MNKLKEAQNIYKEEGTTELIGRSARFFCRILRNKLYRARHTAIGPPVITMDTPAGDITLEIESDSPILPDLARGEVYEAFLLKSMLPALARSDTVFYNVGARWGIISLYAAKCGVQPEDIHNFEADPNRFNILKRNVGDQMHISDAQIGAGSGDSLALDDYAKSHKQPTIIKIDVEGAEVPVLRGASGILLDHRPCIFVEIHPQYKQAVPEGKEETLRILEGHGYDVYVSLEHREETALWEPASDINFPKDGNHMLFAY